MIFSQLVHQVGLVLQPAGGVDQQHVGCRRPRAAFERVEGEAGGVGADLRAATTGQPVRSPQICSCSIGGGAEGVAGGEHDRLALACGMLGQLADGRGLAGAVDADHQDDMRLVRRGRVASGCATGLEDLRDLGGQRRLHLLVGRSPCRSGPARSASTMRARRSRRRDRRVISSSSSSSSVSVVELALGEDAGDAVGELGARSLRQARPSAAANQPVRRARLAVPASGARRFGARHRFGSSGCWFAAHRLAAPHRASAPARRPAAG